MALKITSAPPQRFSVSGQRADLAVEGRLLRTRSFQNFDFTANSLILIFVTKIGNDISRKTRSNFESRFLRNDS